MTNIIKSFNDSLQALYDHVGFVEDWVVYAVDDKAEMFWQINGGEVKFAETMEDFNSDGDYCTNEIYTQRFYDKHVYRGKELTMIFVDTHTDGNKFFAFFSNDYEIAKTSNSAATLIHGFLHKREYGEAFKPIPTKEVKSHD